MSQDIPNETKAEPAPTGGVTYPNDGQKTIFVSEHIKKLMDTWSKTRNTPPPIQVTNDQARWINRKERRMHSALARRADDTRPKYDVDQAIKALVASTIESKRTQRYLNPKGIYANFSPDTQVSETKVESESPKQEQSSS